MSLAPCNQEIYEKGAVVAILDARSQVAEAVVKSASESSGIEIDWHYVAGRAVVKTLGDAVKAKRAIEFAMPSELL